MKIDRSPFLQMLYYIKTLKFSGLFSEDISLGEYVMLELIDEMSKETDCRDVWVSDIVKQVEVTPQAVSKFINLAVSKEFIERFENANDRRGIGVRITDNGRTVLIKTGNELNSFLKSVFTEFSEEELAMMHVLMGKLRIAAQNNYSKLKKK